MIELEKWVLIRYPLQVYLQRKVQQLLIAYPVQSTYEYVALFAEDTEKFLYILEDVDMELSLRTIFIVKHSADDG